MLIDGRKFMKLRAEDGDDWYFHVKNPVQPERVIMMMDPCVSFYFSAITGIHSVYMYDKSLITALNICSKQKNVCMLYVVYIGCSKKIGTTFSRT